jgi:hypothetical protein
MILVDIVMALVVVAVSSAVVVAIVGRDGYAAGGWPTAVVVFGMFFLVVWAGGIWLTPLGPDLFGGAAAWIPFIIVGFFGALFVTAVAPLRQPRTVHAIDEQAQAKDVARTTVIVIASVATVIALVGLLMHYVAIAPLDWRR